MRPRTIEFQDPVIDDVARAQVARATAITHLKPTCRNRGDSSVERIVVRQNKHAIARFGQVKPSCEGTRHIKQ